MQTTQVDDRSVARTHMAYAEYPAPDLLHRVSDELENYQNWIADLFAKCGGGARQVLDYGCGTGALTHRFFMLTSVRPIGIEIDCTLAEVARSKRFEVFSTLQDCPRFADLIFSSNVLEHIEDDEKSLAQMFQKLVPGGRLALFLPAFPILWSKMDDRVGHYRRYKVADIQAKLRACGFVVERAHYADSMGFFITLLYKILPTSDGNPNNSSLRLYDRFLFPISRLLDNFTRRILGKNVFVIARRPE